MPIFPGSYYLNGPSLSSATTVFLDSDLTICAPDGYYSDGVITREQVGCSLIKAIVPCPACGVPCSGVIHNTGASGTGYGFYNVDINMGSAPNTIGAIVIEINSPTGYPIGIFATIDGVGYNALSSEFYGYLAGPTNFPTFIGDTALNCGLPGTTAALTEYDWDGYSFVPTGLTPTVTVAAGQVQLTATDPGVCVMVIPRTSTTSTNLNVFIYTPCPTSEFNILVSCPVELPSFTGSFGVGSITPSTFCFLPLSYTYYVAPVNGDGITLGLYDWVFSDPNGQFVLPDGYYRSPNVPSPDDTFQVADGVIIAFSQNC